MGETHENKSPSGPVRFANAPDVRPGSTIPYAADVGLSVDTDSFGPLRLPLKKSGDLEIPELPKAGDWKNILNRTIGQ